MPRLISVAEFVKKLKSVCTACHNMASYTFRKIKREQFRLQGDAETYEARCRQC